eukprot:GHRQ01028875.1.p1 GENE.GHRQ01028875.1~~GHRQ01028875.1.p1  ORF type:complete len:171 (+),score=62.67 GHRQ01028875.1:483-995(+)
MVQLLGQEPAQYCSADAALSLAKAAYQRAAALTAFGAPVVGLAASCALAAEPPKRGQHRAYVAAHSSSGSRLLSVVLAKGARSRWQEEQLVGRALLQVRRRLMKRHWPPAAGGSMLCSWCRQLYGDEAEGVRGGARPAYAGLRECYMLVCLHSPTCDVCRALCSRRMVSY